MEQSSSEKPVVLQLVHKFPALYGRRRFITVLTQPATCPCPEPYKSPPNSSPSFFKIYLFSLYCHVCQGLYSYFFSSGSPSKSCVHFFFSHACATFHTHLILLHLITLKMHVKKGKVHPCTGTEALYRPGVAQRVGRGIAPLFPNHGTRRE